MRLIKQRKWPKLAGFGSDVTIVHMTVLNGRTHQHNTEHTVLTDFSLIFHTITRAQTLSVSGGIIAVMY